uniref:L1 transposable element RRM domain-containing protein n=1 Tax=Oryzias melastigma TaxID=30732 RepID=A0A3B3BLX0_ORYME
MPRHQKQHKLDQFLGVNEDSVASGEASVSSDANMDASGVLPDISPETLLNYIAKVVGEQGKQTQKSISEAFSKFELAMDTKIEGIGKRIEEVAAIADSIVSRQTDAETRISGLEDEMIPLKSKVVALEKLQTELKAKIIDLEGRSRRDNIRILNLIESVEGKDPVAFFEKFIPKVVGLSVTSVTIDRAHRIPGPAADARPRPVIIKLHYSKDVAAILSAARRAKELKHEDRQLRILPDIPPAVRACRRAFNPVCAELIKRNVRFQMGYPAVLSFKMNGAPKMFRDPESAKAFLQGNI